MRLPLLLLPLLIPAPAAASFLGQEILYEFYNVPLLGPPNLQESATAVIGPGTDFTSGFIAGTLFDLDDTSIVLGPHPGVGDSGALFSPGSFIRFSDAGGSLLEITGVTVDAATTVAGVTPDRLSFGADFVEIEVGGLLVLMDDLIVLDVSFVPEPGPGLLLLAAFGAAMRPGRKRSAYSAASSTTRSSRWTTALPFE